MRETGHTEKVWLPGQESKEKQMFLAWLRRPGTQADREFISVTRAEEIAPEDRTDCRVLLFGSMDSADGTVAWRSFEKLTETLLQAAALRPRRLLFVSDMMVYGKLFGEQRLVREDEIGYLSHTTDREMAAQCLRTVENLCFRLAREEGLNAGIVRADWKTVFAGTGECRMRETLLNILENGAPGEVFNLSEESLKERILRNERCAEARSPLSPITVIPDTGKAENYAAS